VAHFNFAGKGGTRTKGDIRRKWPRWDLQGSSGNEVLRTGHQGDAETVSVSSYVRTEIIRKSDSWWEDATCSLVPNVSLINTGLTRFEVLASVLVRIRVLLDVSCVIWLMVPDVSKDRSEVLYSLIIEENVTTTLRHIGKFPLTDTTLQIRRPLS